MEIFIFTEQLNQILKAPHSTKIYGEFRVNEGLAHVLAVGERYSSGREIGIVSTKGLKGITSSTLPIVAVVNGKDLTFFYNKGELVPVELVVLKKGDTFKRTPFDQTTLHVLNKTVVVVFGAGTGGSHIALALVRAGIGEVRICDYDIFKIENASMHEGNFTDTGMFKTGVAEDNIHRINPNTKVRTCEKNLLDGLHDKELSEFLDGCDLVVASMDHLPSSLYLNRVLWLLGIPAVFGGCYEQALGGEVFFTIPKENTPCLECLRGGLSQPEQRGEIDYSTATGPEDYEGEPGLHSAVNLVTSIEVQIILGMLLRNTNSKLKDLANPKKNFLLIGGALGAGFYLFKKPFHIFHQPLKGPRKDCDTHRLSRDSDCECDVEFNREAPLEFQDFV